MYVSAVGFRGIFVCKVRICEELDSLSAYQSVSTMERSAVFLLDNEEDSSAVVRGAVADWTCGVLTYL